MATFVLIGGNLMGGDEFLQSIKELHETDEKKNEILSYNGDEKVRVVVKEPLKQPEIILIGKGYQETQKVVGGRFECIPLGQTELDIYVHEDGKAEGLTPNLKLMHQDQIYDICVGTVMIGKIDGEGEIVSLTPNDCFQAITELEKIAVKTEREALHFKRQLDNLY